MQTLSGAADGRPSADTVGLVLAAGQGRRLGLGAKALLRTGGVTLVERAIGALTEGGCARVLAVVGAQAEEVAVVASGAGGEVVPNPDWDTGLASSFRAGVDAVGPQAARLVVLLVDQPGVGAPVVARLLARHRAGTVTAAEYADQGGGAGGDGGGVARHPMVFDVEVARAAAALAEGDRGARAYLRRHPELLALVDCTDLGSGADVDTPADLHLL